MGYWKNFSIFCQEASRQLGKGFNPESESKLHEAYALDLEGLPWRHVFKQKKKSEDVETVTCPHCEREVAGTANAWHCFYCGSGQGSVSDLTYDPNEPDDEYTPQVKRQLKKHDRDRTLDYVHALC